jgi:hypothetical protein
MKKQLCFSALNTVNVKNKGIIWMRDLKVGDMVQTSKKENSFSRVLSFMHMDHDMEVDYVQIYMEDNDSPLEISHDHFLVNNGNRDVVLPSDVHIGDLLSGNRVTRIQSVRRKGLYAPVTENGTILVSGIPASCYVNFLGSLSPNLQVFAQHAALAPLRLLCRSRFSICKDESHLAEGFSSNLLMMTKFGLEISVWNGKLQLSIVMLTTPILVSFFAIEAIVSNILRVVALVVAGVAFLFFLGKRNILASKTIQDDMW